MKTGRRILSFALVLTMLLGCMCIQAAAADEDVTLTISSEFYKFDEQTDEIGGDAITEAKPGDIIVVTLAIKNNTASKLSVGAYSTSLEYDTKLVEPYRNVATEDENASRIPFGNYGKDLAGGSLVVNATGESGSEVLTGAITEGNNIKAKGTADFAQVAFKVLADAESGTAKFGLKTNADDNVADEEGEELSFALGASVSLSISGVTPTLGSITMTKGGAAFGNGGTVSVDGTGDAQTIQVKALSKKGNDITDKVEWSLAPAEAKGVEINEATGVVTIAKNAAEGTYSINALPKDGESQADTESGAMSVSFKVGRTPSVPTSIEITGGVDTIYLPGSKALRDGEFAETVTETGGSTYELVQYWEPTAFTATVKDQYGDVIENPAVTWTFTDANEHGPMYRDKENNHNYCKTSGCSHENCEAYMWVDESKEAAGLEISASGHLMITNFCRTGTATVKAVCGDASATKQVTVQKADSQVASVEITSAVGASNDNKLIVPADTDTYSSKSYGLTAKVLDQYGIEMSGQTVTWSVVKADDQEANVYGLNISGNGESLFISNLAKSTIKDNTEQTYYLKATCGSASAKKEFTVRRADPVAASIALYKDGVEITGDTDTIIIPGSNIDTAHVYTAAVLDQYGAKMTNASVTWAVSGSCTEFRYSEDELTDNQITFLVGDGAVADTEISLTASYGASTAQKSRSITVTLKDIEITAPTVTTKTAPPMATPGTRS